MAELGPCGCRTTKEINAYLESQNTSACNSCGNFKQMEPGIYGCSQLMPNETHNRSRCIKEGDSPQ